MKVLILNGSPRVGGNTTVAVEELEKVFRAEGVEVETVQVGTCEIRGCIACGKCAETGKCVFDDIVNELAPKFEAADGLIAASPVYYASANATLVACLTRLFYSTRFNKAMKVGASVVCARRGGCSATFDELNKFFTIAGMPVASSQYWNSVHGRDPGDALHDEEGRQTMRTLARNMTFLMRSIALGKEKYGCPKENPLFAPISSEFCASKKTTAGWSFLVWQYTGLFLRLVGFFRRLGIRGGIFVLQLHLGGRELLPVDSTPCFSGRALHLFDELRGFFLHGSCGGSSLFPHLWGFLPHLGGSFLVHLAGGVLHAVDSVVAVHRSIAVEVRIGILFLIVLLRYLNGSIGGTGGNAQSQQIFQKSHKMTS